MNNGMTSRSGIVREGEIYKGEGGLFLKPYMIAANCFVDVFYNGVVISLTKHEFVCLLSGISRINEYYDFLKLLTIANEETKDEVGGLPSHMYANNVLELSSNCFMFATQHNNKVVVCLKKDQTVCILPEAIFNIEFDAVHNMLHTLAKNYANNWCFYCDQHKTLKSCIVCSDDIF